MKYSWVWKSRDFPTNLWLNVGNDRAIHCESKKLGHFFTAYNFRNIEQIFTKFGTNQSLFILNILPEFI